MTARTRMAALCTATVLTLAACAGDADETAGAADTAAAAAQEPAAMPPAGGGLLDPDAASRAELLGVGLDSTAADALISGRPYASMLGVDSVLAAAQLDEGRRDSVYARVWKPIDLNTASEAEILLIPGVGERMKHEFEEYRPYASMEVFRREIGKYVDDAEVARLERYVEIR